MRALNPIYQDICNFEVLSGKQHDFSIHQRNLQVLMTEIYKIVNGIATYNEFSIYVPLKST